MDMKSFSGHSQVSAFEKPPVAFPNLGEILVSTGRLSADAVARVTARQRERGIPFGAAAIELGLVTQADGGYLTSLGLDAAEHAQALLTILRTEPARA